MASTKERKSYRRILVCSMAFLMLLTCGCSIGRIYVGSEIKEEPEKKIQIGSTTKGQILEVFGPPARVQKQFDGDIFIYAYLRKNSTKFAIEEPYITNITFFTYTRTQEKKDALVILFDKEGVVKNYGFQKGTLELTAF